MQATRLEVHARSQVSAHELWQRTFDEVGEEYPEIEKDHALVDATTMWMVKNPEWFDVIVTCNMFGDIITDLGAMIQGGMGIAASGNLHPGQVGMFEPIHGSAPDISGSGMANPVAMIWSGAMMLEFLGETEASGIVLSGIRDVLSENENLTPDIGGKASTVEVGDAIVRNIQAIAA